MHKDRFSYVDMVLVFVALLWGLNPSVMKLGEYFGFVQFVGAAVIFAGLYITKVKRKKRVLQTF